MKLIDRYIFQKFFSTFLVILSIITLLIILIHVTENVSYFKEHNLSFYKIFNYYVAFLPYMINFLGPIIVFITTIWITTRMAQCSEIIAMLSGGISFNRIIRPYLIIACILTGCNFYLTGWLLADANKERVKFDTKYLNGGAFSITATSDSLHLKVGANQYLYIKKYHAYNNTGYNVSLDTFENAALVERLHAEKIRWNAKTQTWEFRYWHKRTLFPKHETITEGYTLALPLQVDPEDFTINPNLKEGLTLSELDLHIKKLMDKGNEAVRLFVAEKYVRYMTPFAIIILITLGFLVAVRKPRGSVGTQITLGFILACLYIVFFLSAKAVIEKQSEHQLLDIWMPNIIFSVFCIIFYRLVPK
ncbi:LptF/LptG family permease [Cardinium endosymbiont of Culicoides punctatus]|uniref:LptF/LptG family permease n=1 Tax=Cardinium endosymbiont of Culicoides punctatus TaxID=2304601 RepID=UPI0010584A6E|nr:LptF/LptG family permease [Cardinium endosymbiont of Culicoides punctatus]TDG95697.1 hypothetical protein CCPUN_01600 [Cardinium endosymbiont of Culicoides punctatus]